MPTDKEVKEQFRQKAMNEPEKHYPFEMLKSSGFQRKKCPKCGVYFWARTERSTCGNANCQGGYTFIGNPPTKKRFDYLQTWKEYEKFFKKLGYLSVPRKPVVARWRNDTYWVGASVYGFQPYVVLGEIKPPSNAVVIPQLSLRFNDIDNVGITGSHYVCFDMLGQLHFEKKKDYDMAKYFTEYYTWIVQGMGVSKDELVLHEDAWAGGGTFGPCIEFFSRGLEIGNQVYMQYAVTDSGSKELDIKVLDMGQGHERVPWLCHGNSNSYETTFPTVVEKLKKITAVDYDEKLMQKFLPYSAYLNVDEVDDIDKTWGFVAGKVGLDVAELKEKILPLQAVYSIAEHARAALVALQDGALPSNVGGGYNLRIILRRALGFIEEYGWKVDLAEVAEWNAVYLKPLYPELVEETENVRKIFDSEKAKFVSNRKRSRQIISNSLGQKISEKKLVELYDCQGINPDFLRSEFAKQGKEIVVPDDFYAKVSELHEQKTQKTATRKEKLPLPKLHATGKLYLQDWKKTDFSAKVVYAKENFVVLDKTLFYPTSGGQIHDLGTIEGERVSDIILQDNVIVHIMKSKTRLKEGASVNGEIDFERRKQLTQHHSGAHLVNLACQNILGRHCWQAGAAKEMHKARLDITHYAQISDPELKKIEAFCNDVIKKDCKVKKEFLSREKAEEKYGMRIYQGGFVPGKELRIVSIVCKDFVDSEACGGTHVNSTGEVEHLKILNSTRIQDGVIRINYVCGKASAKTSEASSNVLDETAKILGVSKKAVPARAEELFKKWKIARKALKKKNKCVDLELKANYEADLSEDELLKKTANIFSTQPENISTVAKRFMKELSEMRSKLAE